MKGIAIYKSKNKGKGGPPDTSRVDNVPIFEDSNTSCLYLVNETNSTKILLTLNIQSIDPISIIINNPFELNTIAPVDAEFSEGMMEVSGVDFKLLTLPPRSFLYFYVRLQDNDVSIKTERITNIVVEYVDE